VAFLITLDDPKDVCDYVQEYLGTSQEINPRRFAEGFVSKANQLGLMRGSFNPQMWRGNPVETKVGIPPPFFFIQIRSDLQPFSFDFLMKPKEEEFKPAKTKKGKKGQKLDPTALGFS